MKKNQNFMFLIALFFVLVIALVACGTNSDDSDGSISIATGSDGGVYYTIGGGMSDLMNNKSENITASAETSGGAEENIRLVGQGDVEFGLSTPTADALGYEGAEPFEEEYSDLREVMGGYMQPGHFVVREDSDIQNFTDMEGKTISLPPGSSGTFIAQDVLEEYGLEAEEDYEVTRLDYSAEVDALKNRQIDVAIFSTAAPNSSVTELISDTPIRLIGGEEDKLEKAVEKKNATTTTIPAGTYDGVDEDILTYGLGTTVITNENVSDETVYEFLDIIDSNFDDFSSVHEDAKEFSEKNIELTEGVPLHPGAEKWLKENDWVE